jgi:3-dehydroquinate synthase
VVSDTVHLGSLPVEELRSGLVEVVKMAFLLAPSLLDRVDSDLAALLAGDPTALAPVVAGGAEAKIRVVEEDPEEKDRRRLLNFGHTLGHAVEAVLEYEGLRHGECVAYGLLFALRLSVRRGLDEAAATRLVHLLRRFELPPLPELSREALMAAIRRDKKARESGVLWVLALAPGRGETVTGIGTEEVEGELDRFLADPWSLPT